MDYSVNMLTTASDCQSLIDGSNLEKEVLDIKKRTLEVKSKGSLVSSAEIETTLTSVSAELTFTQSLLDTMEEGPAREITLRKFKKLDYQKSQLEERRESYGVLSLLERQNDIARASKEIEEIDLYITALTDRMNSLPV